VNYAKTFNNWYKQYSISTLARRHYENEIDVMVRFDEYLSNPINPFKNISPGEPKKRMPIEKEKQLAEKFYEYIDKYALK